MPTIEQQMIGPACEAALEEVLETMFFELPGLSPASSSPPEDALEAGALYSGSLCGEFRVAIEPDTLARLTVNFLGLDEDEAPGGEQCEHVLFELTNMLCGASLSRLEPDGRLRIEPPVLLPGAPSDDEGRGEFIAWPLDTGAVWVRMTFRESGEPEWV